MPSHATGGILVAAITAAVTAVVVSVVEPFASQWARNWLPGNDMSAVKHIKLSDLGHSQPAQTTGMVIGVPKDVGNRVYISILKDCSPGARTVVDRVMSGNGGAVTVPVKEGQCWKAEIEKNDSGSVYWIPGTD